MIECILLRLDAPLMSFGGTAVDQHGVTEDLPTTSLLVGLLGNALGYTHREHGKLQRLQDGVSYAARRDRLGVRLVDYQTVDLGQSFMVNTGWTTWGRREDRAGAFSQGTHIRYRHYHADAVYTVAVSIDGDGPDLDALEQALRSPARPLFIGRKGCLPSGPLLLGRTTAESLRDAVCHAPVSGRHEPGERLTIWYPSPATRADGRLLAITDERDWRNQIHGGRRLVVEEHIDLGGGDA